MTRTILFFVLSVALAICLPLVAAQKSKSSTKAPVKAAKAPIKGAKAKTTKSKVRTQAKAKPKKPAVVAQQHPTSERYVQIQQALVDRGYLTEANGVWGTDSVEALRKFQQEQDLPVDGKLGALSLTALGLGPRRGSSVADAITAGTLPMASAATPLD